MRIIGGNLKGKTISLPKDKKTRPLRDLVKESIFNLIEHSNKFHISIKDSNILDLFSGSGSFGLECASRGAKKILFIENYTKALTILNKNISILKVNNNCQIIDNDCFNYLLKNKFSIKFDIIFIDPPYKEDRINSIINNIKKNQILNSNGIMIIHRHKKDDLEISKNLNVLDERKYGISKIIIGN
jgi:16S rRNA (guanine966-N2)-methyltransferase